MRGANTNIREGDYLKVLTRRDSRRQSASRREWFAAVAIAADRIDPGRPTKIQDVAAPNFTRTQATTDAGVSERQRKAALRLANIPEDEFEGRWRASAGNSDDAGGNGNATAYRQFTKVRSPGSAGGAPRNECTPRPSGSSVVVSEMSRRFP